MNIKSLDNQTFNSRSDRNLSTYNPRRNPRHHVDNLIALDDNSIRKLAYAKTLANTDDNKNRKIVKGMFAAIPVISGITTALLEPAESKLISKHIKGVSARLLNGAKSAGVWGVLLGVGAGIYALKNKLEDKSPAFNQFSAQNPLLTFAAATTAFVGTLALGGKYLPKLVSAVSKHINPSTIVKFENNVSKYSNKFNRNKYVKSAATFANNVKQSKYFAPFKGVVKAGLDWAPSVLLMGAGLQSFMHGQDKQAEFVRNYSDMKEYQLRLAKSRIRELSEKNNELHTAQTRENVIKQYNDEMIKECVKTLKELNSSDNIVQAFAPESLAAAIEDNETFS